MAPDPVRSNDDVLQRVQGEFLEMPGLRLTEPQARRLWGLDAASCAALLSQLIDKEFLFRTRDGAFMRVEHARPPAGDAPIPFVERGRRVTARSYLPLLEECPPAGWFVSLAFEPSASQPKRLPPSSGRSTFGSPPAAKPSTSP